MCNSKESYGGIIGQFFLCAGVREGGKDGCFYDSGGPLMCENRNTNTWYLVGMMIWGDGCAQKNKYGVYANIAKLVATIKKKVKGITSLLSSRGTYSAFAPFQYTIFLWVMATRDEGDAGFQDSSNSKFTVV